MFFTTIILSLLFPFISHDLSAMMRSRPLASRLPVVGNAQRQQLVRRTALRSRLQEMHAMHKRRVHGVIFAEFGPRAIELAITAGTYVVGIGAVLKGIYWEDDNVGRRASAESGVEEEEKASIPGVFKIKYTEEASKAKKAASALGYTMPASSFAYDPTTGVLSLLPKDLVKPELTVQPDWIVHPHGVHKFFRNFPFNAGKFPKDPQTVLDEAVYDNRTGKLWGVEDGRLVYFTPLKDSTGSYYEGIFHPKARIYSHALQLAINKQQEIRAQKAQRDKEYKEALAKYETIIASALPSKVKQLTTALITATPPEAQDATQLPRIFKSSDAYKSQHAQEMLNGAIREPFGTYINVNGTEIVRFIPVSNTNHYTGFVLRKAIVQGAIDAVVAELQLQWVVYINAKKAENAPPVPPVAPPTSAEIIARRSALPEGLFNDLSDMWTSEQKINIKKAYADLRIVFIERGRLGDLFISPYVLQSFRNLGLPEKTYLQDFFVRFEKMFAERQQVAPPVIQHPYGLYGALVAGLGAEEPQNKQKTLDEAVKGTDDKLYGREGEKLFLFEPRWLYAGGADEAYIGILVNNPILLAFVKKKQAEARAPHVVPQPPDPEDVKVKYAGQHEYEDYAEENSFPSRLFDPELQKAIAQTHQERGTKTTVEYAFDQKTIAALEALDVDLKTEFASQYAGNCTQHHVHRKFIASLNKIGGISLAQVEVQNLLRGAIVLNKTGQEYNNQHRIKQALSAHQACDMVIDYAKAVADCGAAAGEGVLAGIRATGKLGKGALDVVTHLEEYVPRVQDAFHKATLAVSKFVAVIREDIALMAKGDDAALRELTYRRNARDKFVEDFAKACAKNFASTPLRDQIKAVVQLFTECKSLGTVAELFCESVELKKIAAGGAFFEDTVLNPQYALAEEVVHIAAHTIDVEPMTVKMVFETAQYDTALISRIKKTRDVVGRQVTAYFDATLDVYKNSPGFIGVDAQKPITQIAGLSVQAVRELKLVEYLDASVGDVKKLQEALKLFADNKSAICAGGPLTILLSRGAKNSDYKWLNNARGSAFELERGYDLAVKGEKIILFAGKYPRMMAGRVTGVFDVDIETASKFIECKNCDWKYVSDDRIRDMKTKLPQLAEIALSKGKTFELHSKYPIPNDLKEWLRTKNISFVEG